MPKGSTPRGRMEDRFTLLSEKLKKTPDDYSAMTKLRRKVNEFLGGDSQKVTSKQRYLLEQQVKKIDRSLLRNSRKLGDKQVP